MSNRIGITPNVMQIKPMKRKWASCSTSGWVMLSKDLLRTMPRFREFVILHELVHLQVPNHGKLFKNLMHAFIPEWQKMEGDERDAFARQVISGILWYSRRP